MPVIVFANPTGGAGKTTSALLLASELAGRGATIAILDAEPEKWITQWGTLPGKPDNVLTRTSAAVASRAIRNVRDQLDQAGIPVFTTSIVERAAYRDILDYGGLLADLDRTQVSNVEKAVENARAFAGEVVARLKDARATAEVIKMGRDRTDPGFSEALDDLDLSEFTPRKSPVPRRPSEETSRAAEAAGFRSREPKIADTSPDSAGEGGAAPQRRRRTGRNAQFNLKARPETIAAYCALADRMGWGLGETLEKAVALLEERYNR